MKIYFACDHAGLNLKNAMLGFAKAAGYTVEDLGAYDDTSVDYPDYALKLVQALLKDSGAFGVLTCGTGIGMSIAANRFRGIRAAVCNNSLESARLARAHNHANVLCLGGRLVDEEFARQALEIFLHTGPEDGRHSRRVEKLDCMPVEFL